jgi:hypothetical protein
VARPLVAEGAKIHHRARHPTKQSHLTAIEVNPTESVSLSQLAAFDFC